MLEQTIERWFDEATLKGLRQGRQEGRQLGLHQGLAKALALQLQLRFGPVPAAAHARLEAASPEQLLQWMAALLTATSVQELFGDQGGPLVPRPCPLIQAAIQAAAGAATCSRRCTTTKRSATKASVV